MQYETADVFADHSGFILKASKIDGNATFYTKVFVPSNGTVEDTANKLTSLIEKLTTARNDLLAKHGTVDQEKIVTSKIVKGGA